MQSETLPRNNNFNPAKLEKSHFNDLQVSGLYYLFEEVLYFQCKEE